CELPPLAPAQLDRNHVRGIEVPTEGVDCVRRREDGADRRRDVRDPPLSTELGTPLRTPSAADGSCALDGVPPLVQLQGMVGADRVQRRQLAVPVGLEGGERTVVRGPGDEFLRAQWGVEQLSEARDVAMLD